MKLLTKVLILIEIFISLMLFINCQGIKEAYENRKIENKIKENFELFELLINKNEYNNALSLLNEIIKLDEKNLKAYINRALIWEIKKEFEYALNDLNIASTLDRNNYQVHFNMGNVYFQIQDYNNAILHYSKSIEINKSYSSSYLNRANSYLKLKEFENALIDYKQYVSMSDNQRENVEKMIEVLNKELKK